MIVINETARTIYLSDGSNLTPRIALEAGCAVDVSFSPIRVYEWPVYVYQGFPLPAQAQTKSLTEAHDE